MLILQLCMQLVMEKYKIIFYLKHVNFNDIGRKITETVHEDTLGDSEPPQY